MVILVHTVLRAALFCFIIQNVLAHYPSKSYSKSHHHYHRMTAQSSHQVMIPSRHVIPKLNLSLRSYKSGPIWRLIQKLYNIGDYGGIYGVVNNLVSTWRSCDSDQRLCQTIDKVLVQLIRTYVAQRSNLGNSQCGSDTHMSFCGALSQYLLMKLEMCNGLPSEDIDEYDYPEMYMPSSQYYYPRYSQPNVYMPPVIYPQPMMNYMPEDSEPDSSEESSYSPSFRYLPGPTEPDSSEEATSLPITHLPSTASPTPYQMIPSTALPQTHVYIPSTMPTITQSTNLPNYEYSHPTTSLPTTTLLDQSDDSDMSSRSLEMHDSQSTELPSYSPSSNRASLRLRVWGRQVVKNGGVRNNLSVESEEQYITKIITEMKRVAIPENDNVYYNTLKSFLKSEKMREFLETANISLQEDKQVAFLNLLKKMQNANLSPKVEQAVQFYLQRMTHVSTYQSSVQSTQQPEFQLTVQPTYPTTEQPVFSTTGRPVFITTGQPAYSSTGQPEYPSSALPVQRQTYQPIQVPSLRAAPSATLQGTSQVLLKSTQQSITEHRQISKQTQHGNNVMTHDYSTLTKFIKEPVSQQQRGYYNTLRSFLSGESAKSILHNQVIETSSESFRQILIKIIKTSTVSSEIQDAAAYYYRSQYFDPTTLLGILGTPKYEYESTNYETLKLYFASNSIYHLNNVDLSVNSNIEQTILLKQLLAAIAASATTEGQRNAAKYYLSRRPFFDYSSLIEYIPKPKHENEVKLYQAFVEYLRTEQVYMYSRDFLAYNYISDTDMLMKNFLSFTGESREVPETIRVAAKFYQTILKPLNVAIQKVLTKKLDLKSIFSDSFDFSTFTSKQYDAFDRFFRYISDTHAVNMNSFDKWTDVTKRGEFTALLLQYLAKHFTIPPDVANSIQILTPLIHMYGSGSKVI